MKTLVLSVLSLILLTIMVSGCTPAATPIPHTFTAMATSTKISTPTSTFTSTPAATATQTLTPSPSPFPTVPMDFKRVTLNEINPDLIVSIPISFEIPRGYFLAEMEFIPSTHFWMTPDQAKISQTKHEPPGTSYFEATFSQNVGYDSGTDKFLNSINDMNDKKTLKEYEAAGVTVNNVERVNVGEFPILILEADIPWENTPRKAHFVYVASLVETNVVLVTFYFSLPLNPAEDYTIWQHFKNSLEGKPGVGPTPLVPFITATP